jgi:ABC-type antimicrobial peptide transport system ATPase subunit
VGVLIEDKDIFDLSADMQSTSNASIILVFENLKMASSNHLRAFTKQLTALGVTYTPQYIDQATYTQIVSTPMEKGKQYRKRNCS